MTSIATFRPDGSRIEWTKNLGGKDYTRERPSGADKCKIRCSIVVVVLSEYQLDVHGPRYSSVFVNKSLPQRSNFDGRMYSMGSTYDVSDLNRSTILPKWSLKGTL